MAKQCGNYRKRDHGADHGYFTMREVNQLQDAVDHGVTQCHKRIHTAEDETVDELL